MEKGWQTHAIEVRNELADLESVISMLDGIWEQHSVETSIRADLNIAAEEILTNIIRHGGPGGKPSHLDVAVSAAAVRIRIRDCGVAFNPLRQPPPDTTLSLDERSPGGLGIFLVRQLMDHAEYERRDGMNCFTMVKSRPGVEHLAQ